MKRTDLLTLSVLAMLIVACDRGEPGRVETLTEPPEVVVSPALGAEGQYSVPARIVAAERAEVATRISGTVREVLVEVGALVRRGDVLMRLDDSGVESSVLRGEAQATVARRTYERIRSLEADGAATELELDQAVAALEVAEASLGEARAARDYVLLRAPFDGVVTARMADPGDLAMPGRPVLRLASRGAVKIEADVPATLAGDVGPGDRVSVVHLATGDRWTAVVNRTVPFIELASHRFRLEAGFEAPDGERPRAGTYVRMEFGTRDSMNHWVPADAVVRRGQLAGAYVLEDGLLRLRWLRTGRRRADAVEVLSGLSEGDLVVRSPGPALTDGMAAGPVRRLEWSMSGEDGR
jgi:RND family efflux transporter MFP subunit